MAMNTAGQTGAFPQGPMQMPVAEQQESLYAKQLAVQVNVGQGMAVQGTPGSYPQGVPGYGMHGSSTQVSGYPMVGNQIVQGMGSQAVLPGPLQQMRPQQSILSSPAVLQQNIGDCGGQVAPGTAMPSMSPNGAGQNMQIINWQMVQNTGMPVAQVVGGIGSVTVQAPQGNMNSTMGPYTQVINNAQQVMGVQQPNTNVMVSGNSSQGMVYPAVVQAYAARDTNLTNVMGYNTVVPSSGNNMPQGALVGSAAAVNFVNVQNMPNVGQAFPANAALLQTVNMNGQSAVVLGGAPPQQAQHMMAVNQNLVNQGGVAINQGGVATAVTQPPVQASQEASGKFSSAVTLNVLSNTIVTQVASTQAVATTTYLTMVGQVAAQVPHSNASTTTFTNAVNSDKTPQYQPNPVMTGQYQNLPSQAQVGAVFVHNQSALTNNKLTNPSLAQGHMVAAPVQAYQDQSGTNSQSSSCGSIHMSCVSGNSTPVTATSWSTSQHGYTVSCTKPIMSHTVNQVSSANNSTSGEPEKAVSISDSDVASQSRSNSVCHSRCASNGSVNAPLSSVKPGHVEPSPVRLPFIRVPFGWKRITEGGMVVYLSPTGFRLTSREDVIQYLQKDSTCKCGLECPLLVDKVFNFEANMLSREWTPDEILQKDDLSKLCNHKRKIVAMATLKSGLHTDGPGDIPALTSSDNLEDRKDLVQPKKKKAKGKQNSDPYDGMLVSQLLSQREKIKAMQSFSGAAELLKQASQARNQIWNHKFSNDNTVPPFVKPNFADTPLSCHLAALAQEKQGGNVFKGGQNHLMDIKSPNQGFDKFSAILHKIPNHQAKPDFSSQDELNQNMPAQLHQKLWMGQSGVQQGESMVIGQQQHVTTTQSQPSMPHVALPENVPQQGRFSDPAVVPPSGPFPHEMQIGPSVENEGQPKSKKRKVRRERRKVNNLLEQKRGTPCPNVDVRNLQGDSCIPKEASLSSQEPSSRLQPQTSEAEPISENSLLNPANTQTLEHPEQVGIHDPGENTDSQNSQQSVPVSRDSREDPHTEKQLPKLSQQAEWDIIKASRKQSLDEVSTISNASSESAHGRSSSISEHAPFMKPGLAEKQGRIATSLTVAVPLNTSVHNTPGSTPSTPGWQTQGTPDPQQGSDQVFSPGAQRPLSHSSYGGESGSGYSSGPVSQSNTVPLQFPASTLLSAAARAQVDMKQVQGMSTQATYQTGQHGNYHPAVPQHTSGAFGMNPRYPGIVHINPAQNPAQMTGQYPGMHPGNSMHYPPQQMVPQWYNAKFAAGRAAPWNGPQGPPHPGMHPSIVTGQQPQQPHPQQVPASTQQTCIGSLQEQSPIQKVQNMVHGLEVAQQAIEAAAAQRIIHRSSSTSSGRSSTRPTSKGSQDSMSNSYSHTSQGFLQSPRGTTPGSRSPATIQQTSRPASVQSEPQGELGKDSFVSHMEVVTEPCGASQLNQDSSISDLNTTGDTTREFEHENANTSRESLGQSISGEGGSTDQSFNSSNTDHQAEQGQSEADMSMEEHDTSKQMDMMEQLSEHPTPPMSQNSNFADPHCVSVSSSQSSNNQMGVQSCTDQASMFQGGEVMDQSMKETALAPNSAQTLHMAAPTSKKKTKNKPKRKRDRSRKKQKQSPPNMGASPTGAYAGGHPMYGAPGQQWHGMPPPQFRAPQQYYQQQIQGSIQMQGPVTYPQQAQMPYTDHNNAQMQLSYNNPAQVGMVQDPSQSQYPYSASRAYGQQVQGMSPGGYNCSYNYNQMSMGQVHMGMNQGMHMQMSPGHPNATLVQQQQQQWGIMNNQMQGQTHLYQGAAGINNMVQASPQQAMGVAACQGGAYGPQQMTPAATPMPGQRMPSVSPAAPNPTIPTTHALQVQTACTPTHTKHTHIQQQTNLDNMVLSPSSDYSGNMGFACELPSPCKLTRAVNAVVQSQDFDQTGIDFPSITQEQPLSSITTTDSQPDISHTNISSSGTTTPSYNTSCTVTERTRETVPMMERQVSQPSDESKDDFRRSSESSEAKEPSPAMADQSSEDPTGGSTEVYQTVSVHNAIPVSQNQPLQQREVPQNAHLDQEPCVNGTIEDEQMEEVGEMEHHEEEVHHPAHPRQQEYTSPPARQQEYTSPPAPRAVKQQQQCVNVNPVTPQHKVSPVTQVTGCGLRQPEFGIGDLVWGQIPGYPSWPGKIVLSDDVPGLTDTEADKMWVRWFGDHTFSEMEPQQLKSLADGLDAFHRTRKNKKGRKANAQLDAAVHEMMQELDGHQGNQDGYIRLSLDGHPTNNRRRKSKY